MWVRMIRGCAYHPQTQGSVEIANRTFKNRLRAAQLSYGRRDWVDLLLEIAFIINTTTSRALPRGKTPFDVWFGRPRRWLQLKTLVDDETEVEEDGEDLDTDLEGDDSVVLSAIEAAVAKNNIKVWEQMRRKGGKTSKVFDEKEVATLAIPRKMRLNTENSRLTVRIVNQNSNGYKLLSRHGLLKGRYQGGKLNKVDGMTSEVLG